jgi:hypothetical protein
MSPFVKPRKAVWTEPGRHNERTGHKSANKTEINFRLRTTSLAT